MMAKIVLVALFAFVAVQLSLGLPTPKPDEVTSEWPTPKPGSKPEPTTTDVTKSAANIGEFRSPSPANPVLKEGEVKVGVDAVEAVKTLAAEPAKEVAKDVAKA